jgi:predicted GNAT superfamily acetyltransferase
MAMPISIHPVTTIEECREIERLQAEIWASNDLEVTPDHVVLTLAKEGSIVLLAVDETETPIGFAFGFLGYTADHRVKYASHMVGVLPAFQNSGIGYQLKLAQREAALARQIDLMTWTFDPLQGRNARFNLRKLGAICHTYLRNLYGDMRDGLNVGLPSDRFLVEWWLASEHVSARISGDFVEPSLSGCPILDPHTLELTHYDICLVETPVDIAHLKADVPDIALQWRLQTREVFEITFAAGYTAVDFIRREDRNYYVLQKNYHLSEAKAP